ncbi:head-tail adaptor Ad1 [Mycobacterium phage Bactobuster]|uniref:Head-to-tail adaptor n=3 Tax=Pukovnikvirus TaxID=2948873 RepID=A0A127KPU1_9CAUD|nr:head-tail adaptor Ad1 [Mycobacterium phage Bactobuster]YP_010064203.1 head-tail adaptor Ad1 [Mycobacterium phage IronMan]YP_010064295.1 head-tail adaptor Ad1 [Mycobacterium phage Phaded]APC43169.1 head-to-tail adaptor [Mycobacterium phage Jaan]AMO43987.1 head-to-tail adaptor [Mycobacterium phage Bactobuster]AZS08222.1 head-to-tail adaptor [Mycobacterium phage IronMan]QGZ16822.1 head-to-tail adaptor [Mycobacterium phage Phaded]
MAYAKATDVVELWAKEPEPEVMGLITRRLEQVERMIKRRIPNLDLKVAADATFEADLIDIESDAVLRLVRNPEGYISETDGAYTYQLAADLSQGRLVILDDEWTTLGVRRLSRMSVIAPNIELPT